MLAVRARVLCVRELEVYRRTYTTIALAVDVIVVVAIAPAPAIASQMVPTIARTIAHTIAPAIIGWYH